MLECTLYLNYNKKIEWFRYQGSQQDEEGKIEEQADWRNGHAPVVTNDEGEEEEENVVVMVV